MVSHREELDMARTSLKGALLALTIGAVAILPARAEETIKLGLIEPFSGPIAAVGLDQLEFIRIAADRVNANGGVLGKKLEIVELDNAMKAEKTTEQLRKAIDEGIRFVTQGVGSNHALNIIQQLEKHNKRNPDKAVLYLNHSAVTTAFTNELCSFWHFRFDANVDMKVAAILTAMNRDKAVKNVYMLNQNYAYGKSFQEAANKLFPERIENAKLVGDDLMVPFGKVQDFTPFVAKLKSLNADTVLTGNWGPDLIRFVKATADAGLNTQFYTIYGGLPSSIAGYGKDAGMQVRLKQITESHENMDQAKSAMEFAEMYKKATGKTWYADRNRWVIEMFVAALEKAGTDDPKAVALALEGMSIEGPLGEIVMRASDHQIQIPMVLSEIDDKAPQTFIYNNEDYGIGFKTLDIVSKDDVSQPTTCKMNRPS